MIVEERVDRLENLMAHSQLLFQGFVVEMREFKKEVRKEMKDFKSHTEATIDRLSERLEKDRKDLNHKMNVQWEKMVKKLGTVVEDIVAPNIRGIAEKYFGCKESLDFGVRRWKVKPANPSQGREFDVVAVYADKVIVNETKSNPCDMDEIKKFVNLVRNEFFEYFPEYDGKEVVPIFASLYIPEHIVTYLTKNKIYAMGMKEDTMDLLNYESLM